MCRGAAVILALVVFLPLHADEEHFDPPLEGAYLGIRIEPGRGGIRITTVEEGSAADRAGLRPGDLLLGLGRESNLGQLGVNRLPGFARSLVPGKKVAVELTRDGKHLALELLPDPALVRDALYLASQLESSRYLGSISELHALLEEVRAELPLVVRRSRRTHEAYEALNRTVGRLGISHTAVIPPWTYDRMLGSGHRAEDTYHLGFFLKRLRTEEGGRAYHVESVMAGGPAAAAGLIVGDQIVAINSVEIERSPRRILAGFEADRDMYTVHLERDEKVIVAYRRRRGGEVVRVEPRADVPLSSLRTMHRSVRLLETSYGPLGYVHFWDLLPSKLPQGLRQILRGKLRASRGLVVDLRGRGGQIAVLKEVAKVLQDHGRPVVLLIDSRTRSAKEVLAFLLKGKQRFTLIGERTAGAVRPGVRVNLPSGGTAMLPGSPRQVLNLTRGTDLEKRGVEPDIKVRFPLPYAAGRDPILERAISYLREELARRRRMRV